MPRAGPTSSEDLTRVKPSEGLPNVSWGSTNIVHRAVRLRMVLGLRALARSRRNDTDSFVQYWRDPNKRLSVGPSLRLVAVCSSKNCKENGRSFKNWKVVIGHYKIGKNSPNLSVIHLVHCRIPVPNLGSKEVQRSSEEHWKDVKQRFQTRRSKGFLTCVTSFSLSFSLNAIPSSPCLALEQRKARARSRSWKCIGQVVRRLLTDLSAVHIFAEAHIGST